MSSLGLRAHKDWLKERQQGLDFEKADISKELSSNEIWEYKCRNLIELIKDFQCLPSEDLKQRIFLLEKELFDQTPEVD